MVESCNLTLGVIVAEQPYATVRSGIQRFSQETFPFQQLGIGALTDVRARLGQHFQQGAGTGPFYRLQGEFALLALHQQVNVALVDVCVLGAKSGACFLGAAQTCGLTVQSSHGLFIELSGGLRLLLPEHESRKSSQRVDVACAAGSESLPDGECRPVVLLGLYQVSAGFRQLAKVVPAFGYIQAIGRELLAES